MRFKIALQTLDSNTLLPFSYNYYLSAAIYKIIERADNTFSQFLHHLGYVSGSKRFKLFTFSEIQTPFEKGGSYMRLTTRHAQLIVCFYMPQAAENFIKGLFMNQQLEIADHNHKAVFNITGVESLTEEIKTDTVLLQPLSPLVVGRKNSRGHYDYLSPEDAGFTESLIYNWIEKWCAVQDVNEANIIELRTKIIVHVQLLKHPPQQRLITIKAGTSAETKIRGYIKFHLVVTAPEALLKLALGAGLGLHNAQGFGCVWVV